jgi:exodeoxyribonuclease VII large subunit
MGRLPFDPEKMKQARRRDGQPLSVSQLATRIGDAIARGIPDKVRVVGEVSGFRDRTHWYFDLKDASAVVGCVMFASAAKKAGFTPEIGQQVLATGRVEFWNKGGRTSLKVEKIEPVGVGALELEYRKLVEELRGLGWFASERKRAVPTFPRRVAVVTSRTGAALQDVIDTMRKRCPSVGLVVVDALVQGDGAAPQVSRAVRAIGAKHAELGIDALLVTRGGGSMEDLWAFNEKIVAQAIVECPIPVVAAIGHETDTTIAELAADLRCATPTQAAVALTPDSEALREQLDSLGVQLSRGVRRRSSYERHRAVETPTAKMVGAMRARVASARAQLARVQDHLEQHRPSTEQARRERALADATARLHAAVRARTSVDLEAVERRALESLRHRVALVHGRVRGVERELVAVGPASVMARGFSVTLDKDGRAVRSIQDVRSGDKMETRVADGSITSVVRGGGEQLDLFGGHEH